MAEPLKIQSPWGRIVDVQFNGLTHGLADAITPNHVQNNTIEGKAGLNRFFAKPPNNSWSTADTHFENNANQFGYGTGDYHNPNMYTGEMRLVVADHMARGLVVPYDYKSGLTHGIFVAANGDRWVIEITSGSYIYAWPMPKLETTNASLRLDTLDYIPGLAPRPDEPYNVITNPTGYLQLTTPGLSNAYGNGAFPLYSECGWAFSSDGKKCGNVFFKAYTTTDNPATGGLTYYKAHRYEITITEAGNKPLSATCTEVESDWVWGDRVTHIKYPSYSEGSLRSFDWYGGNASPPWNPAIASLYAPLHVWYEGSTAKVIYLKRASGTTNPYNDGDPPAINPAPYQNSNPTTAVFRIGSTTTGTFHGFDTPVRSTMSGFSETGKSKQWVARAEIGVIPDNLSPGYSFTNARSNYTAWSIWERGQVNGYGVNDSNQAGTENIIIPFGDRQAFFHHWSEYTFSGSSSTRYNTSAIFIPVGEDFYKGPCGDKLWGWNFSTDPLSNDTNCFSRRDGPGAFIGYIDCNIAGTGGYFNYNLPPDEYSAQQGEAEFFGDWSGGPNNALDSESWSAGNCGEGSNPKTTASTAAAACQAWCTANGYVYSGLQAFTDCVTGGTAGCAASDRYYCQYTDPPSTSVSNGPLVAKWFTASHYSTDRRYTRDYYWNTSVTYTTPTTTYLYGSYGYIDGSQVSLTPADSASAAEWSDFIDGAYLGSGYQWMISCPDPSGNRSPIYTSNIVPDVVGWPSGLYGDATYPYDELQKIYPCYVGNP